MPSRATRAISVQRLSSVSSGSFPWGAQVCVGAAINVRLLTFDLPGRFLCHG